MEPNDYLQGLLGEDDDALRKAILEGIRALGDVADFGLEELPEIGEPLAFDAWLMGLKLEEEEREEQHRVVLLHLQWNRRRTVWQFGKRSFKNLA